MSNYTGFSAVRAGLGASNRLDKNSKDAFCNFSDDIMYTDGIGGAAATTDAAVNSLLIGQTAFQFRLEQAVTGAPLAMDDVGLVITSDDTDNEGFELNLGRTQTAADTTVWLRSRGAFKIGTDAAFFMRLKLKVADVSDSDDITAGFSVGSYVADGLLDTYSDYAVLSIDNGDIKVKTNLNSGTQSSTDTTQNVADAGTVTLEVRVGSGGKVKFLIDGAAPTTDVTGFTFDDADTVHAFYSQLNDVAGDPGVTLIEWESGFLSSRGLDGVSDLTEALQNA